MESLADGDEGVDEPLRAGADLDAADDLGGEEAAEIGDAVVDAQTEDASSLVAAALGSAGWATS